MLLRTVSLNRKVCCVTIAICARRLASVYVADVDAVDGDASLRHVVEAQDQVGERALAAAAHADQRHHLAAADLQVDVAQHRAR